MTCGLSGWTTRKRLHEIELARPDRAQADEQLASQSTRRHYMAIMNDAAVYESLLPLLPGLGMPALLITGGQDPTTSPEQRDAFRTASPRHATAEFEQAGHSRIVPDTAAAIGAARMPPMQSASRSPPQ
jgi:pimeloyl-ACP methyl ester carboxylesterase